MGREVKRVPLDFNWPLKKVWSGYLIETCLSETVGCENCRQAARLRGIPFTSYDCPDFDSLLGPPRGDGWQMWETTSEGSPISPVFDSPEKLAEWLAETEASAFGRDTATYDQWLEMIKIGSVPSMVVDGKGIHSGVAGITTGKPTC